MATCHIKEHGQRVYVCEQLGSLPGVTIVNIVMCKRLFVNATLLSTDPQAVYLYTLRFMLERLSWIARDAGEEMIVTFAHVKNFPYHRLNNYLALLNGYPGVSVHWPAIRKWRLNQPNTLELLQAADIAASATLKAFQPDRLGVTEQRYLRELAPRLYRRPPGALTSYGMKLHPSGAALALFPWVATL